MKKFKVAVYLNGQWRGSSFNCAKFLKPLLEQFDTDYYIHTCDYYKGKDLTLNFLKKEIEDLKNIKSIKEINEIYHSQDDIELIKKCYDNVVYFQVDSREKNLEIDSFRNINMSSFYNLYGGYKCNKYRKLYENKKGFQYDAIIKLRPDIIIRKDDKEILNHIVQCVSNNPDFFTSEHSFPDFIEDIQDKEYPIDIFHVGKNFFDLLDNWVEMVLNGNAPTIGTYVKECNYPLPSPNSPHIRPDIMREIYKYGDLLERYYNDANGYDLNYNTDMVSLNRLLYNMIEDNDYILNYFKDWDINVEDIIKLSTVRGEPFDDIILGDLGLKELANQIMINFQKQELKNENTKVV